MGIGLGDGDRLLDAAAHVLPQAFSIALPPVGSRLIGLMKDTLLASTVTVTELTRLAEQIGATPLRY